MFLNRTGAGYRRDTLCSSGSVYHYSGYIAVRGGERLNRKFGAVILIALIGTVLRIVQIGFQPLQMDELFTLMVVQKPYLGLITFTLTTDCTPPLFYILSHTTYILSGFSETAIRYPSLLFGILELPAIYYLGKVIRNDRVGLLSAALAATSYPLIYYSQFGRAYMMEVFLFTVFLALFVFIRTNQSPSNSDYYILGLIGALCIWTHLFALIPVLVFAGSLFFTHEHRQARSAILPPVLLTVPLIPLFFAAQTARTMQDSVSWSMSIQSLLIYTPVEFFSFAFPVFFLLLIAALWTERTTLIPELLVLSGIMYIIGISVSQVTAVLPHYFLGLLPLLIVISMIPVTGWLDRIKDKNMKPVVAVLFLILVVLMQVQALVVWYTVPVPY